jgi:hypothetical protein
MQLPWSTPNQGFTLSITYCKSWLSYPLDNRVNDIHPTDAFGDKA